MNSPRLRTAYSPLFAWEDCTFVNQFVTRSGVGHPDNFFLEGACAGVGKTRHISCSPQGGGALLGLSLACWGCCCYSAMVCHIGFALEDNQLGFRLVAIHEQQLLSVDMKCWGGWDYF